MASEALLLVGAGGHARSCIDVIEQDGRYRIVGLVGVRSEVGREIFGYRVLGSDDNLPSLIASCQRALVTVGQIKNAEPRIRLFERLQALHCELPTIVSPRAQVSRHAVLGDGTIVMHGAMVNAGARVGRNCIINTLAVIEHDVIIGDHCHIATAAVLNGGVQVGTGTFVGSNVSVKQALKIGDHCVIGMGQTVRESWESGASSASSSGRSA